MREAFSSNLVQLALDDPSILLLTGDHGYALFDEFRRECPGQYFNAGIAEQNMVGMAAGLARLGYRPFVYGLAAFIPIRTVEQIKLDIAHDDLPVVLIGDGAGFVYSHLGTSHQSTEDIACTRAIPSMQILSPSDRFEMEAAMKYSSAASGPIYLRMGKADRGDVHPGAISPFQQGVLLKVRDGSTNQPGLIATGSMVSTAVSVGKELNLSVWSAPMIKPLDASLVASASHQCNGIVTLEEHSVLGGLGSVVSEILCDENPTRVLRIGVQDRFSIHCGSYEYLLDEHCLSRKHVFDSICQFSKSIETSSQAF